MPKKPKVKSEIKKSDVSIRLAGNGLIIEHDGNDYMTAQSLVRLLIDDKLKTKAGEKSKSIMLGLLSDGNPIDNDSGAWLTKKGKAFYFSIGEEDLYVTSVELVRQLLDGETDDVTMGVFVKEA